MGTLLAKLKTFLENCSQQETRVGSCRGKTVENANMKEGSVAEREKECEKIDDCAVPPSNVNDLTKARENVSKLEGQICKQRLMIDEHQAKIVLLEQLIERQCLILKKNDDNFTYEQLAKSSRNDAPSLRHRVENLVNSMIEKKEGVSDDNAFANIKHEFEAQRQQLQEHDECIKKHEEGLEDQLARIETMREMLDENSNHIGCDREVRKILHDHERRLTALEERMAVYEKQVERRLAEQHQLLVFTWIGLVTTFVLCFAIVCSCCWFQ